MCIKKKNIIEWMNDFQKYEKKNVFLRPLQGTIQSQ